jgi:nicotinate-nucleotide adenylyltransferase
MNKRKKDGIGILGGTFNPIHLAHLRAAEVVREEMGLEKILFIPSGNPPHKPSYELADVKDRYNMTKCAISSNPNFELSVIEIEREGNSYTVDTLSELKKQYGQETTLYFIIGADILSELTSWKDYKKVFQLCEFVVVTRPGFDAAELVAAIGSSEEDSPKLHIIEMPLLDISSSDIRERIQTGRSIKYLVPDCVEEYIVKHGSYR